MPLVHRPFRWLDYRLSLSSGGGGGGVGEKKSVTTKSSEMLSNGLGNPFLISLRWVKKKFPKSRKNLESEKKNLTHRSLKDVKHT